MERTEKAKRLLELLRQGQVVSIADVNPERLEALAVFQSVFEMGMFYISRTESWRVIDDVAITETTNRRYVLEGKQFDDLIKFVPGRGILFHRTQRDSEYWLGIDKVPDRREYDFYEVIPANCNRRVRDTKVIPLYKL